MNKFKDFFKLKKDIKNETYGINDTEFLRLLGIEIDGLAGDKMREATYFTCVKILCDTISKLPLKLYQDTENGIQKASQHYLYKLLKLRPNPYMSSSDFWKCVEFQRLDKGHAIVYMDTVKVGKNLGQINALYPLNMDNVSIWIDNAGIISNNNAVWYVWVDNAGKEYKLQEKEVLHFKGMTKDGISGIAIKDYLKTIVENAQSGQQYVNNYFKGGLFAKGLLQYTGDIEPNAMKKMQARFENMANGIQNAGKILPVPLGFSFTTVNSSMADAQFLELNQLTIKQIAAAFGIKPHMLGDLERSTYSNIEHQSLEFYRDTLQSILLMYEQELTYKLLTTKEIETNYYFRFNVDSILRADIKTRYDAYRIGIQSGFLKINEVRQLEELGTVDEGDTLICNGNMIPVSMAGNQYNSSVKGGVNNSV